MRVGQHIFLSGVGFHNRVLTPMTPVPRMGIRPVRAMTAGQAIPTVGQTVAEAISERVGGGAGAEQ